MFSEKHLYEISFWSRTHEVEGIGAFISERCTQGVFRKYLTTLMIPADYFQFKTVVDIGCGPRGSLHCFEAEKKYGVDPLAHIYAVLFGINQHDMTYLSEFAHDLSLPSDSVDVVVSVNSLDHCEELIFVLTQIRRVLKEGGEFRLNFNLQPKPTLTEPTSMSSEELVSLLRDFFSEVTILKVFPPEGRIVHERILVSCIK